MFDDKFNNFLEVNQEIAKAQAKFDLVNYYERVGAIELSDNYIIDFNVYEVLAKIRHKFIPTIYWYLPERMCHYICGYNKLFPRHSEGDKIRVYTIEDIINLED